MRTVKSGCEHEWTVGESDVYENRTDAAPRRAQRAKARTDPACTIRFQPLRFSPLTQSHPSHNLGPLLAWTVLLGDRVSHSQCHWRVAHTGLLARARMHHEYRIRSAPPHARANGGDAKRAEGSAKSCQSVEHRTAARAPTRDGRCPPVAAQHAPPTQGRWRMQQRFNHVASVKEQTPPHTGKRCPAQISPPPQPSPMAAAAAGHGGARAGGAERAYRAGERPLITARERGRGWL